MPHGVTVAYQSSRVRLLREAVKRASHLPTPGEKERVIAETQRALILYDGIFHSELRFVQGEHFEEAQWEQQYAVDIVDGDEPPLGLSILEAVMQNTVGAPTGGPRGLREGKAPWDDR